MKSINRLLVLVLLTCASTFGANAQYYQMANQLTNMLTTALNAGASYKGFAEASYIKGIGHKNADFLEITTTQGVKYSNWFFMGVGAGADIMFSNADEGNNPNWTSNPDRSLRTTAVMVPLYTDFRFDVKPSSENVSFFADLRLGAEFLIGKNYVRVGDGYITNGEYFYLKPSVGFRVPVSTTHQKQALNFAVSYKLMTANYWYQNSNNTTLNGLGVSVNFEW